MKKSFVFPGQGSQKVGMGKQLYDSFRVAKDVFDEVDDSLSKKLSNIIFNGPQEELTLTENAQPAIMAVSMAVMNVLEKDFKIKFRKSINFFAGHSLGEYTALAAANSLSISDVAKILFFRGQSMQSSTIKIKSAMAAFMGADIKQIREIAKKVIKDNEVCDIANYNTETQLVLSGDEISVDKAISEAKQMNIRSLKLQVSAPFHSVYMRDTADALKHEFKKYAFNKPEIEIISNVGARPLLEVSDIVNSLIEQTFSTVRWYESILYMVSKGINSFYEIGYGTTLCGIIKRIESNSHTRGVCNPEQIESLAKEVL